MRNIRKYLVAGALTTGLAVSTAQAAVPAEGWLWVGRWKMVFSTYGGPTVIGDTADELIYAYCQHNGIWGWQTYAWVPSLNQTGWIRNGDITGFTDPILGLNVC